VSAGGFTEAFGLVARVDVRGVDKRRVYTAARRDKPRAAAYAAIALTQLEMGKLVEMLGAGVDFAAGEVANTFQAKALDGEAAHH
jgi:hypothetical protein